MYDLFSKLRRLAQPVAAIMAMVVSLSAASVAAEVAESLFNTAQPHCAAMSQDNPGDHLHSGSEAPDGGCCDSDCHCPLASASVAYCAPRPDSFARPDGARYAVIAAHFVGWTPSGLFKPPI